MNIDNSNQALVECLKKNYLCLHRQYRLGGFEQAVAYVNILRPVESEPGAEFYELCNDLGAGEPHQINAGAVSFKEAVNNLYGLTLYIEQERTKIARTQALLILQCKCLVYEATDYMLNVPPALGTYFIECAEKFPHLPGEVEQQAEELNGGPFPDKDARNKVIKTQLIAALCGANHLYRRHGASAYERALQLLEKLNRYILEELPRQHEQKRESFGLIGLAQYLTGRVLSGKGSFTESRVAFRLSAEAYVARLRQKEDFSRQGNITPQEYEEKVSVTLRRAALVTAFGNGYLAFVNSQLTRALESLTLARAALSRNSGLVYLTYVDMLYWACHRAAHSCDGANLERVIAELSKCRETFRKLVPNSHYFHRAGIQLAVALYYRAKLPSGATGTEYEEGMRYLDEASKYAAHSIDGEPKNPHLLAAVLVARSRFLSAGFQSDQNSDPSAIQRRLEEAEADATRACDVSAGIREMESEAWATLGEIYIELAEFHRSRREKFYLYFDKALATLQQALKENHGENIRIDAVCYLRLTKLCLLNQNTKILAYEYFEQWQKIEHEVEHDYWKVMAQELQRNLGGPFLLIKARESLSHDYWDKKVSKFLLEETLKRFVAAHEGRSYTTDKLNRLLANYLRFEMGYGKNKVAQLLRDEGLMKKVVRLRARPPKVSNRRNLHSYSTKKGKTE